MTRFHSFLRVKLLVLVAAMGVMIFSAAVASAGTTPALSTATFKTASDKLLLTFNMPVFATANGTGNLDCTDFTFAQAAAGGTLTTVNYDTATCTHVAGNSWVVIEMPAVAGAGDTGATITPVANQVFTVGGAVPNKAVALTADAGVPTFTAKFKVGADKLLVTFSEPVWTSDMSTAAFNNASTLTNADFAYTDGGIGDTDAVVQALTAAQNHTGDRTNVQLDLNVNLAAGDTNNNSTNDDSIDVANGTAVYDIFGNAAASAAKTLGGAGTTADSTVPTITSVEAVIGKANILVNFSEPVFTDFPASVSAVLDNTTITNDLTYTDTTQTTRTLNAGPAVATVAGNTWVLLTLNSVINAVDITTATADTIKAAADGTAVYDAFGNGMANGTPTKLDDTTDPVILTLTLSNASNKNLLTAVYSEGVTISGGPAANSSQASTTAIGDVTTAGTFAGFGAFATPGTITYRTLKNTVGLNTVKTTFTLTMAGQSLGIRTSTGTQTEPSGIFTPTVSVVDIAPNAANAMETTSTHATLAGGASWDVTAPTAASGLMAQGSSASNVNLAWSPAAIPADFSRFEVYYKQSTGSVTVLSDSAWTTTNDTALATSTTSATNVTDLSTGFNYYFTVATVDIDGNPALSNETNIATSSTSSADATPAGLPTGITATTDKDGHVVLAWTDPTATDLKSIDILRGKNGAPVDGIAYANVLKAVKTYIDLDSKVGDKINYQLRSRDTSNNLSAPSDIVGITVAIPAESTTTPSGTTPATPATPGTPGEPGTTTPATPATPGTKQTLAQKKKAKEIKKLQDKIAKLQKNLAKENKRKKPRKTVVKRLQKQIATASAQLAKLQK